MTQCKKGACGPEKPKKKAHVPSHSKAYNRIDELYKKFDAYRQKFEDLAHTARDTRGALDPDKMSKKSRRDRLSKQKEARVWLNGLEDNYNKIHDEIHFGLPDDMKEIYAVRRHLSSNREFLFGTSTLRNAPSALLGMPEKWYNDLRFGLRGMKRRSLRGLGNVARMPFTPFHGTARTVSRSTAL